MMMGMEEEDLICSNNFSFNNNTLFTINMDVQTKKKK